eukprot:CAMPEP_0201133138 /NCGR_PEP_ID=MMETSP0850-20130426/48053_1 /ASSEMBLY_ACC=CAM_ASM_000622 /TAXON_ID=183588 /ORGANISM="Pseudo-nitzschia fraudulenta, Strain WWA7" /LENGTH=652 /DNA_ID=CAMNT_0047403701 /DNA_START=51 /DNA_END=2009 /DNA_ORIENTATION=+
MAFRMKSLSFLLLLLATAAAIVVRASVSVPTNNNENNNGVVSSVIGTAARHLDDEGQGVVADEETTGSGDETVPDEPVDDFYGKDSNPYIPHAEGTAVRFQDQDGTWMYGMIARYNSATETYTIRWDEDNVEEDFPDKEQVENLVFSAEKEKITGTKKDNDENENDGENYDWNSDMDEDGDAVFANSRVENEESNKDNSGTTNNQQSGSSYQGEVPDNFDFGFTYKYQDLSGYQPWPVGTVTLLEFTDGWYEGKISQFFFSEDKKNATYIVTWSDGTTDNFVNELEWMDLMVANAVDYEPWEIGTPTYGYPNLDAESGVDALKSDSMYLSGNITKFENGAYTIEWSNGDVVVYSDFDMIDELVNNAGQFYYPYGQDNFQPWPMNTPVSWDFDDGWWDGTITGFTDGTYEVTWSDGSSKYYSNLEKINQMVAFAAGDGFIGNLAAPDQLHNPDQDDYYASWNYYELGTLVYAEFKDGWWAGYIDSYEGDYYVVRWSDDSMDKFLPGDDFDEMVINGQYIPYDYNLWPVGTQVYKDFDGKWHWGTVVYSEGGFYEVVWDDGLTTVNVSGVALDEMVANAQPSGVGFFGKFILIVFSLGVVVGLGLFILKRHQRQGQLTDMTEQVRENEIELDENPSHTEYSDQPEGGTSPATLV